MTFYQELQLDQVGSKSYIASITDPKEKRKLLLLFTQNFSEQTIALSVSLYYYPSWYFVMPIWVFTIRMAHLVF